MLQPRERSINAALGTVRHVCFWRQGREHLGWRTGQRRAQPARGAPLHPNCRAQPVRRTPAVIVVNELSTHATDLMPQRVRPAIAAAVCSRGVDDARPVLTSDSTTPDDSTGQPAAAAADAPKPLVPTTRLAWLTPDHAVNESRPSCKPPGSLRAQRSQPPVRRPATMGENFYGKSLTTRKWVIASKLLARRSAADCAAVSDTPALFGAYRRDVAAAGPGCRHEFSALNVLVVVWPTARSETTTGRRIALSVRTPRLDP
jgi:hypothetical protein